MQQQADTTGEVCILNRSNITSRFGVVFVIVLAISVCFMSLYSIWQKVLPNQQMIGVGEEITAGSALPPAIGNNIKLHLHSAGKLFSVDGVDYKELTFSPGEIKPVASEPGQLKMQMRLFGFIPLHQMTLNVVTAPRVIPGGQSIGILMHPEGIMVVGEAPVAKDGKKHYPAREAGIQVGDLILRANGIKISGESQLQDVIDNCGDSGKHVLLLVKHGGKTRQYKVKPMQCDKTGRFRVGLFVKGTAAGVGTLTFYEPASQTYGALGHIIADINSGQTINLDNGRIVDAEIKNLNPGRKGQPGEKMGVFKGTVDILGNIEKNTAHGIFGKLEKGINNPFFSQPVPVLMKNQIKEGPAEIFTVLNGSKTERFSINIERVLPGEEYGKDMIINVTDPKLLERAGGIIQGMSGSPVVQDGKLAGAVTHVFINDPARGYGVAAENMFIEVNLMNVKKKERLAS